MQRKVGGRGETVLLIYLSLKLLEGYTLVSDVFFQACKAAMGSDGITKVALVFTGGENGAKKLRSYLDIKKAFLEEDQKQFIEGLWQTRIPTNGRESILNQFSDYPTIAIGIDHGDDTNGFESSPPLGLAADMLSHLKAGIARFYVGNHCWGKKVLGRVPGVSTQRYTTGSYVFSSFYKALYKEGKGSYEEAYKPQWQETVSTLFQVRSKDRFQRMKRAGYTERAAHNSICQGGLIFATFDQSIAGLGAAFAKPYSTAEIPEWVKSSLGGDPDKIEEAVGNSGLLAGGKPDEEFVDKFLVAAEFASTQPKCSNTPSIQLNLCEEIRAMVARHCFSCHSEAHYAPLALCLSLEGSEEVAEDMLNNQDRIFDKLNTFTGEQWTRTFTYLSPMPKPDDEPPLQDRETTRRLQEKRMLRRLF